MGRLGDISPRTASRMVTLSEFGKSNAEIARITGVHKSTVGRQLVKIREMGGIKSGRLGKCGRKMKTTPRSNNALKRLCLRNRFQSSTVLAKELRESCGIVVCPRTVRNRLRSMGLTSHRAVKKPLLTKVQCKKRLEWAKEHKEWNTDRWRQVLFSDETKLNIDGNDAGCRVFRRASEALNPSCTLKTRKYPCSVMIWGCFAAAGVGRIHVCESTVNAWVYKRILQDKMVPSGRELFQGQPYIFQDDLAPCHRAKIIKDYVTSLGHVVPLPWPGNSPDMNPIENLWRILKRKVHERHPTNKVELINAITDVWHNCISSDMLRKLVDSMPKRCAAVVKSKGHPTKY